MKNLCKILIFGVVGLFLGVSCGGSDSIKNPGGAGGTTGAGGAGCEYQHYFSPACGADAVPRCTGAGGACFRQACGCDGHIITGCANEFAEPYAYLLPEGWPAPDAAMTCDPNSPPVQ